MNSFRFELKNTRSGGCLIKLEIYFAIGTIRKQNCDLPLYNSIDAAGKTW